MHPLLLRLSSLRRGLWFLTTWRGLCSLAVLVLGAGVVVGLIDYGVHLPMLVRALLLMGVLGGAAVVTFRYLLAPLWTPTDDLSLALRVEAHFPQLNDALGSAVQFLQAEDDKNAPGSVSMRKRTIADTEKLAEDCEFKEILNRKGVGLLTLAAIAALVAAAYFLSMHTPLASIAVARLVDPFGNHPWTQIEVAGCPHRIAIGQPYDLRARISGIVPGQAVVEIQSLGLTHKTPMPIKLDSDGQGGLNGRLDMTQHKGEFKFRIIANDGVYPPGRNAWHTVEVLPPPKLVALNGLPSPQIELHYPAYTDLPSPASLAPGAWQIDAVAGTSVKLRACADRPLAQAWVEFRPDNPLVRLGAMLAPLGQESTLETLGALVGGHAVWGSFHARIESDRKIFAVDFQPWVSGYYFLHIEDHDKLAKDFPADLRVNLDPLPTVQLLRPGSSLSVLPDAEISFHMVIEDEQYGIKSVYAEYRRRDAAGNALDPDALRFDLYDHAQTGRLLPQLAAGLISSPLTGPDLRLRPRRLELTPKWALKNRFKEGDVIVLQICAEDFCDLYLARAPGRSHEVEIHIVGKQELARILDDGLAEAQQELVRVQQMQEDAIKLIKEIQKNKDKVGQKERDQLIEAEQLQKQILERVGENPDEGMRQKLAKLNQLIKDNKLPPSDVQDLIKTLQHEMDRLGQEDLQQIEPNLAEARKQMTEGQKAPPKGKTPLDKAADMQNEVKKALDDLSKFLDPWASQQQVKGKIRDILAKQKDLKIETEQLKNRQEAMDPDDKQIELRREELKKDLARAGEAQNNLAQKTQDLMDMIAKAQAKRAEQGDKETAQKLKEANKVAKDANLPEKMREIGKNLNQQDPHLNEANQGQNKAIKNLEKMLAALEEGKKDDLERLQKKQKNANQAQEKLEKIAKDQERLQKKVKQAQQIKDPEERRKELERLAEEQRRLEDEAKKNARELAQLNEERASQDLNRAAQEMDKAAEKMAAGENPDENQKEALERLEEAQASLQDFQEELAREQLAKISDRLIGLKERQDAALERSKDLHKKVLAKKQWTAGLLESLGGDQLSQEGLAKEAESLREKIKEAKVFEHILGKAARAMEDAAKVMTGRKEEGKNRRFAEFEKEELEDENKKDEQTRKAQTQAALRLQRLLDSLKNEPAVAQRPPKQDNDGKGGNGEQPQGGMRPQDGIPPMAQLKALRAEQAEVNELTKDFAVRNPDADNLNEAQRAELIRIQADQERIRQLFGEMTAPAEKKGDMP